MEKFNVHVDNRRFTEKPNNNDVKSISINITRNIENLTLLEIGQKLAEGCTILPAIMEGSRSKRNFKETNLVFLDFDNNDVENYLSLEDTLNNEFILNNAFIRYETFSSNQNRHKFRIGFALDSAVTNNQDYEVIYNYLLSQLPTADSACKDSSRLFFGGKNLHVFNLNNRLSKIDILRDNVQEDSTPVRQYSDALPVVMPTDYTSNLQVVNMFKTLNTDALKAHIHDNELELGLTVNSVTEGLQALYRVNTFTLLGLEYMNPMQCIISEDNNPSVSVFKNSDEVFIYKRFSEDKEKQYVFNNLHLISKLTGLSTKKTIYFLFDLLKIKVKYPKEIITQEFEIDKFIMKLESADLKKDYPYIHKVLGRHKDILLDLLILFKENKYEYEYNNKIIIDFIYRLGTESIAEEMFDYISEYRLRKIQKIISVLAFLDIITKLDNEDIPEEELKFLLKYKRQNRHTRRKNMLKLNIANLDLTRIENKAKELKDMGFTYGSFKTDFLTINSDIDTKNKVFNQDKDKKIAVKIRTFHNDMVDFLGDYLLTNDYLFEKDLKDYLLTKYSKSFVKENYNVCINSAVTSLNLKRVIANNNYKNIYNITNLQNKQIPKMIVKV